MMVINFIAYFSDFRQFSEEQIFLFCCNSQVDLSYGTLERFIILG